MSTTSDADLIRAWRSGDQEAFASLVSRYHGVVRTACVRQAAAGEVDDCLQAVFVVLARRPAAAAAVPVLAAWLLRVATLVCSRSRRAASNRRRVEQAAALGHVRDPVGHPEALDHLDACLLRLPEKQRAAVTLQYLAGKDPEEVAAALGTSHQQTYVLVSRGLASLRTLLAQRGIAVGGAALVSLLASEGTTATVAAPASLIATLTATPSAGAQVLAHGVLTAMFIKTVSLVAAGIVLVGAFLTATVVLGAKTPPVGLATPVAAADAPIVIPKPSWANNSGTDQYGAWADLQVGGVTQRFRFIKPGTFVMGSLQSEKDAAVASGGKPGNFDSEVQHEVTISRGYWLADSACTQALWQAIIGSFPAHLPDLPQNPMVEVSWDDCQGFVQKLNGQVTGLGARLPTEAEWEYACRAGTTTAFSFGATITLKQVNYDNKYLFAFAWEAPRRKTVPVKSFPPNVWGLYEMHGNVWQWCSDWYGDYAAGSQRDPSGPSSGSRRVYRGGSFGDVAGYCRSACRDWEEPVLRSTFHGFRLAAQATPEPSPDTSK